jgi:hypothetical protein
LGKRLGFLKILSGVLINVYFFLWSDVSEVHPEIDDPIFVGRKICFVDSFCPLFAWTEKKVSLFRKLKKTHKKWHWIHLSQVYVNKSEKGQLIEDAKSPTKASETEQCP